MLSSVSVQPNARPSVAPICVGATCAAISLTTASWTPAAFASRPSAAPENSGAWEPEMSSKEAPIARSSERTVDRRMSVAPASSFESCGADMPASCAMSRWLRPRFSRSAFSRRPTRRDSSASRSRSSSANAASDAALITVQSTSRTFVPAMTRTRVVSSLSTCTLKLAWGTPSRPGGTVTVSPLAKRTSIPLSVWAAAITSL